MAEVKQEIKTFEVDNICDACQIGQMRPTGRTFMTHPPKYPHKCNNIECGHAETFFETYPKIKYEKI